MRFTSSAREKIGPKSEIAYFFLKPLKSNGRRDIGLQGNQKEANHFKFPFIHRTFDKIAAYMIVEA